MNVREIKVNIDKEPTLYDELYSAMMEGHKYDGCYVMQYSESQEEGYKIAIFMLRDGDAPNILQHIYPGNR